MKRKSLRSLNVLFLFAFIGACNPVLGSSGLLPVKSSAPLATEDPLAPSTATPFQPLDPTGIPTKTYTPTPDSTPTNTPPPPWGSYPAPIVAAPTQIPYPMPTIHFPSYVVNIVLLGSDARTNPRGGRTDTIIIVSLDAAAGTATMLSVPRDLYVYIPGWTMNRINTAFARGGFSLLALTLRYNLGIRVDHWVKINLEGFVAVIDTLGGIDVNVGRSLSDRCQDRDYSFSPGLHHMDGRTALCYVRMRKTTSDFDRLRRQQEVIQAVFNKVLSVDGLSRVPELFSQFSALIQTSMNLGDILPLVPLAAKIGANPNGIRRYSITSNLTTSWRVPTSGASVQLPKRSAIQSMLQSAFGQ
ncbi:MAG: LCP family protein [Anaerolineales bacterium]|jgi:LCP family protein required for cell wall assembly